MRASRLFQASAGDVFQKAFLAKTERRFLRCMEEQRTFVTLQATGIVHNMTRSIVIPGQDLRASGMS